jgi:hypothetical protein
MKLSELKEGSVFRFVNTHHWTRPAGKHVVIDRFPEDRSSGGTKVRYTKGGQHLFLWSGDLEGDGDPEVVKLPGRGTLKLVIEDDHTTPDPDQQV